MLVEGMVSIACAASRPLTENAQSGLVALVPQAGFSQDGVEFVRLLRTPYPPLPWPLKASY